jgi:hypothetical protein
VFVVPVRVQFVKQKEGLFFEHIGTRLPTDSITVALLLHHLTGDEGPSHSGWCAFLDKGLK